MNNLDSSFEALRFSSVNLSPLFSAALNNLWALLAVVVGATMFRFRRVRAPKTTAAAPPSETVATTTSKPDILEVGKSSEKFFTVYYYEEEAEDEEGCFVGDDDVYAGDLEDECESEAATAMMITKWEVDEKWTVEMRGGEIGWYDFQDRSVIDGSVVRLWNSESNRNNISPKRRLIGAKHHLLC
ncbi:hypothetical protein RND81_06G178000 [Saponaria officinalis]|uniref:Transmembrane protein n=1 Tax=Saponaria officinalis TaxID=3572 RepID=A0AAW1KBB3_SAPOF